MVNDMDGYRREDPRKFLMDKTQDELLFIQDNMGKCKNCGEYGPKKDLEDGLCFICRENRQTYES